MTADTADPDIRFGRLGEVSLEAIAAQMSDPRVTEHMPLDRGGWDRAAARAFVAAKEATWRRDGLGHWAIFVGERYAGWGGFQKEAMEWDFGLVLRPEHFGFGMRITRLALDRARSDPRIPFVTFLLPPSRKNLAGLARLGAEFAGEVVHEGARFRKYKLDTSTA
ncbi:RimJ/RimL family protein N-acetyltransferase [Rhodobium orientis]|uniref:GNAT family N-acetyltransferase n=1 Tax=Rhodobium orientis TaxID=34017 RepID=A0A327JG10_9HYPH|nr:GNAT family N-acetyltransferase [Rhodobium orientis]MBB4303591.1 RimJ/RimL family protein N-acetyltransferase [Rhodobium orientis]MBK5951952.1 GNAT family N-acetyltransferase [Rhodobium orientis]RAI24871.1 GNAT family N-acetyltransferase [Rhodobium orientis]